MHWSELTFEVTVKKKKHRLYCAVYDLSLTLADLVECLRVRAAGVNFFFFFFLFASMGVLLCVWYW